MELFQNISWNYSILNFEKIFPLFTPRCLVTQTHTGMSSTEGVLYYFLKNVSNSKVIWIHWSYTSALSLSVLYEWSQESEELQELQILASLVYVIDLLQPVATTSSKPAAFPDLSPAANKQRGKGSRNFRNLFQI